MPRLSPQELYEKYKQGYTSCIFEQHHFDHLMETLKYPLFGDASKKVKGSGKGKLSTPYKSVLKLEKNPYDERQTTGDCVSHGTRNACDITRAVEIDVDGEREAWIARGATEAIYGARGFSGEGMSCSRAAEFVSKIGGIIVRKNYPGIADFSKYNGSLGAGWGGRGLPDKVLDLANDHQIKTTSLIRTVEEARDALANGYGIAVCSNYGFSNKRDSKGYARTSGSWGHCYTSDSMVLTPDGYKSIDSFSVGEKLFNHKGLVDSVSYVFERDYLGDLITIKSWGLPEFSLTNEHPLLISRDITDNYDELYEEESSSGILVIKKRKVKTKIRKLMWVNAEDIVNGDWLATPTIKYATKQFSGLNYIGISNRTKNIPNQLSNPNKDIAWMFGLYIADGNSVKNHSICFTFSINEKSYIDRLSRAFDVLGLNIKISYHETYIRVKCHSSILARTFDHWFGHYSTKRQIPEFLLTEGWDLEALIDGIFCGDGFYAKNIQKISMSNKSLIFQIRHVLINLGYTPSIFEQKRGISSYKNGSSCFTIAWGAKNSKLTKDRNYLYNPIRKINRSVFQGKVYNLEVKNEHSYIVDGVGSHNCMAWIACDDTAGDTSFLVQNSWGKWNDGGHPSWGPIPDGSFLIHSDVAAGMLSQNGAYTFSQFDGFPLQQLPDYGFEDYL